MSNPHSISVLLLEDNPEDRTSVIRHLKKNRRIEVCSKYVFEVVAVDSMKAARDVTTDRKFDIVLLDLSLPDAEGLDGIVEITRLFPHIPLVVLTGRDDDDLAGAAVQAGAQDYLVKGVHDEILDRIILRSIERYELLRQLQEARASALAASEMKSRFLANISHEIRTPLTSVIGFTESLLRNKLTPEEAEIALTRALSNGRHLLRLLDDVLSFSRIEAGKLGLDLIAYSPYRLCDEVVSDLKLQSLEKSLALHFSPRFPLPKMLPLDPTRFKQILFNLVGNALKFTSVGGVRVTLSCDMAAEQLTVDVRDTGIGMSEETQASLFQIFTQAESSITRRFGGTGLGLAISKQLIEMFGGSITVSSLLGEGSTFSVSIPTGPLKETDLIYGPPEAAEAVEITDPKSTELLSGRVLVVDDMPDNRQVLDLVLSKCGLEVVCVDGGAAALNAVMAEEFDLILMDMHMPIQDGYEATAALREFGLRVPIIAVTASAVDTALDRCLAVGCNAYIRKPFEIDRLCETVAAQLDSSGALPRHASSPTVALSQSELDELCASFTAKLGERFQALEGALNARDWKEAHLLAHSLCAAEQFGLPQITRVARALEKHCKAMSVDRSLSCLEKLKKLGSRPLV